MEQAGVVQDTSAPVNAASTVMMDGDTDALENMRKNMDYNLRLEGGSC